MTSNYQQQIDSLERNLTSLESRRDAAKNAVQTWTQASAELSRSAAVARANNQASGRGIMGALLGAKFRSAMRAGAAASNASIAKDVAQKRSAIADGKAQAQDAVKAIQAEIARVKAAIRDLKARQKSVKKSEVQSKAKSAGSVSLLHKLKEAHELGLLTDDEYEQKRRKIVDAI